MSMIMDFFFLWLFVLCKTYWVIIVFYMEKYCINGKCGGSGSSDGDGINRGGFFFNIKNCWSWILKL